MQQGEKLSWRLMYLERVSQQVCVRSLVHINPKFFHTLLNAEYYILKKYSHDMTLKIFLMLMLMLML